MSSIISLVPKVVTVDSNIGTQAAQQQAQIASSELSSLSLKPGDYLEPLKIQALRDITIKKFVEHVGFEAQGSIFDRIEQEAASLVRRGLFSSMQEAENAIYDEYEVYVKNAGQDELELIFSLDPDEIDEIADKRIAEMAAKLKARRKDYEASEQEALTAVTRWLEVHKRLKFVGIDGSVPGWDQPEELAKRPLSQHVRKLIREEKKARQTMEEAQQKRDKLGQEISQIRELLTGGRMHELVLNEQRELGDFIRMCRDPASVQKFHAFVEYSVASLQNDYRSALAKNDSLIKYTAENILGPDPLENPDTTGVEAIASLWGEFADLGNPEQVEIRLQEEREKLKPLLLQKEELDREIREVHIGIQTLMKVVKQYRQKVDASEPGWSTAQIPMLLEKDSIDYSSMNEDAAILLSNSKTLEYAHKKLDLLKTQSYEIGDQIQTIQSYLNYRTSPSTSNKKFREQQAENIFTIAVVPDVPTIGGNFHCLPIHIADQYLADFMATTPSPLSFEEHAWEQMQEASALQDRF